MKIGEPTTTTPGLPGPRIPDRFDETGLASALAARLAGTPLNDRVPASSNVQAVVWVDRGDEVLVHLDSIRTQIRDRLLLVSVDLETDQTGRTPLVAVFAMGNVDDPGGLIAVTDELPRGNGMLASRWGKILQEALWASLLGIALDHANERLAAPIRISASAGALQLHAGLAPVVPSPTSAGTRT